MTQQNLQLGMLSLFEKLSQNNSLLKVTLKNDSQVEGTLKFVDKAFNLFLEEVSIRKNDWHKKYDSLLVRGSCIQKMTLTK